MTETGLRWYQILVFARTELGLLWYQQRQPYSPPPSAPPVSRPVLLLHHPTVDPASAGSVPVNSEPGCASYGSSTDTQTLLASRYPRVQLEKVSFRAYAPATRYLVLTYGMLLPGWGPEIEELLKVLRRIAIKQLTSSAVQLLSTRVLSPQYTTTRYCRCRGTTPEYKSTDSPVHYYQIAAEMRPDLSNQHVLFTPLLQSLASTIVAADLSAMDE
eukprot:1392816-Rhodomonas_salina.1